MYFVEEADVESETDHWTAAGLDIFEEPTWYEAEPMADLFSLDAPRRIGGVLFADEKGSRLLELLYLEGGGLPAIPGGTSALRSLEFPSSGPEGVFSSPSGIAYTTRRIGTEA